MVEARFQIIARCLDCIYLYEPRRGFPECSFPTTKGMRINDVGKIPAECAMPSITKWVENNEKQL